MMLGVISWFPQEYAHLWFEFTALLGVVAVLLLVYHMTSIWCCLTSNAQRARYLALLGYAVLVVGANSERLLENDLVSYRHLGSALMASVLIIVTLLSIVEFKRTGHSQKCDKRHQR